MKNILTKIKIDNVTYLLLFLALFSGYIKRSFIIFSIVLVHELGHVFFFWLFKIDVESVVIHPFGGVTKVNKHIHERIYRDVLMSLGGVFFQILLYLLFVFLYKPKSSINLLSSGSKINNSLLLSIDFIAMLPALISSHNGEIMLIDSSHSRE
jgi:stage IV sporulation protein FB